MKTYTVIMPETHYAFYAVEAESPAHAKEIVAGGNVTPYAVEPSFCRADTDTDNWQVTETARQTTHKVGDMVLMPTPDPAKGDAWQHGNWLGVIVGFKDGSESEGQLATVEDCEGDAFDIEVARLG